MSTQAMLSSGGITHVTPNVDEAIAMAQVLRDTAQRIDIDDGCSRPSQEAEVEAEAEHATRVREAKAAVDNETRRDEAEDGEEGLLVTFPLRTIGEGAEHDDDDDDGAQRREAVARALPAEAVAVIDEVS